MTRSYSRLFFKDSTIVILGNILIYMHGIILIPLIVRTAGVTVYGGFVLFSSILAIVFGISSFGVGFRARRFLPSANGIQALRVLFYPQFFFQMFSISCLALILILLEKSINVYIFNGKINYSVWIIPIYLVIFFFYSQGSDYFRYTSRIQYMMVAGITYFYVHIAITLLFFYFYGYININVLVMSQTLSAFLIVVPCFWIICGEMGLKFLFYDIEGFISDIKLGFPLVLGFIVDTILVVSDRYFIAFYLTVSDVGYYNPAYTLGSLIIFIPKSIGGALPQLMSRAFDENNDEGERMLNYAIKIFLLLAIPFIFGSIILAKPILTLLANSEVAKNAYWVTPIVAFGTLFYGLNMILSNVLYVRLKTYAVLKMNLFAAAFSLLSNAVLLYFFRNIIVAAITTFASYLLAFLYISYIARREIWPVDYEPAVIWKSIGSSLLMGAVLFWLTSINSANISVAMLAVLLGTGIVIYTGGLFALKTFTTKELQFVKHHIFRKG
jgi:O-antigen/teichoic acid export membrane protein